MSKPTQYTLTFVAYLVFCVVVALVLGSPSDLLTFWLFGLIPYGTALATIAAHDRKEGN
jgi:hypothetical protein